MTDASPIFASDRTAARLLDMPLSKFLALVDDGALPPPRKVGDLRRWDVLELRRIINGEAVDGMGDVRW